MRRSARSAVRRGQAASKVRIGDAAAPPYEEVIVKSILDTFSEIIAGITQWSDDVRKSGTRKAEDAISLSDYIVKFDSELQRSHDILKQCRLTIENDGKAKKATKRCTRKEPYREEGRKEEQEESEEEEDEDDEQDDEEDDEDAAEPENAQVDDGMEERSHNTSDDETQEVEAVARHGNGIEGRRVDEEHGDKQASESSMPGVSGEEESEDGHRSMGKEKLQELEKVTTALAKTPDIALAKTVENFDVNGNAGPRDARGDDWSDVPMGEDGLEEVVLAWDSPADVSTHEESPEEEDVASTASVPDTLMGDDSSGDVPRLTDGDQAAATGAVLESDSMIGGDNVSVHAMQEENSVESIEHQAVADPAAKGSDVAVDLPKAVLELDFPLQTLSLGHTGVVSPRKRSLPVGFPEDAPQQRRPKSPILFRSRTDGMGMQLTPPSSIKVPPHGRYASPGDTDQMSGMGTPSFTESPSNNRPPIEVDLYVDGDFVQSATRGLPAALRVPVLMLCSKRVIEDFFINVNSWQKHSKSGSTNSDSLVTGHIEASLAEYARVIHMAYSTEERAGHWRLLRNMSRVEIARVDTQIRKETHRERLSPEMLEMVLHAAGKVPKHKYKYMRSRGRELLALCDVFGQGILAVVPSEMDLSSEKFLLTKMCKLSKEEMQSVANAVEGSHVKSLVGAGDVFLQSMKDSRDATFAWQLCPWSRESPDWEDIDKRGLDGLLAVVEV